MGEKKRRMESSPFWIEFGCLGYKEFKCRSNNQEKVFEEMLGFIRDKLQYDEQQIIKWVHRHKT